MYYRQAELSPGNPSSNLIVEDPTQEDLNQEDSFRETYSGLIFGRRIIDINYFFQELQQLNNHSPIGCTFSDMEIISEKRHGLISGIKMKCKMCNYSKVIWTECQQNNMMNSNIAAVTGIMSIGGGFSNLNEFLSAVNIPSMSENTFIKEQDKLSDAWEATALKEMEIAASEEKKLAIQRGDVDSEGIPLITVIVDGSWAKRSYRTNYASLSGTVSYFNYQ